MTRLAHRPDHGCPVRAFGAFVSAAVAVVLGVSGVSIDPVPVRGDDVQMRFTDVTIEAGIHFRESIGDDKMTNIVEATGVGCAWLDFDGDGWMDIYLVNGMHLEGVSDPQMAGKEQLRLATDRLYRNRGDGTFEDVTERAGILPSNYGMGVAVADYDNDGRRDIYVTSYGPNRLYRNLGQGRFEEVAAAVGVDDKSFGVGAAFVDVDGDGLLDLFVGNYLDYVPDFDRADGFPGPSAYRGQVNRLFRNIGGGRFVDVTEQAGLDKYPGPTMGVAVFDYNDDGRLDLYVANDAVENHLFENKGDGTFEETALLVNLAYGPDGDARGSMGAEVADVDGDGNFDLFVPDYTLKCLYMNQGDGFFEDRARQAGIAIPSGRYVSWGAVVADLDLDTDLDIFLSNGDARQLVGCPCLLFANNGECLFTEVSRQAGIAQLPPRVSRGVAAADMDNDGDLDLLVMNLNDCPTLLRNDTPRAGRHWLMVDLVGRSGRVNRDAIGAVVTCDIVLPSGATKSLLAQRSSSGSYMSVHDQRLHFGLGEADSVAKLTVRWPDGSLQTLTDVKADQVLRVEQE